MQVVATGWRSIRRRLAEFGQEWLARRAGRHHVPDDIRRQARDVAGVTGWLYSRGWDAVASTEPTYLRSFQSPRVPPSLHVSARDRQRHGSIVPLPERCIEDSRLPADQRPGPWDIAELTAPSADPAAIRRPRRRPR